MDLDLSEIKENARAAFLATYWRCVGVAVLVAILTGGAGGFSISWTLPSSYLFGGSSQTGSSTGTMLAKELKIAFSGKFPELNEAVKRVLDIVMAFLTPMLVIMLVVALVIMVLVTIYNIFVAAPLTVGGNYFFMRNATGIYGAEVENVFDGFRGGNYLRVVGTIFLKNLFVFLWSLLLVIPGIIKLYEYRMVPYLLLDHQEMSCSEVFRTSKEMMRGYKGTAFLLDLSFIGLHLLGLLTLGVLEIFYTRPYKLNANAQLYVTLAGKSNYEYSAQQVADIFNRADRF